MRIFKFCSLIFVLILAALFVVGCGGSSAATGSTGSGGSGGNGGNGGGGGSTPPPSTVGDWTWMGGSQQTDQMPTASWPGATELEGSFESMPPAWTDASGNLWFFGGGIDSTGETGALNALWKMVPSSDYANIKWTLAGGSITFGKSTCSENSGGITAVPGVWGTEGQAAATNIPSGRWQAASWTDKNGNFWLFGGVGCDAAGNYIDLNDLWKFDPTTGEWAWMNGGSTATLYSFATDTGGGNAGVYGIEGTAGIGNTPGGRTSATTWTDASGNLWLFGGYGCDSTDSCLNYLNDLWKYSPTTGEWTWMGGSDINSAIGAVNGVYGTKGTAAAGNTPGGRSSTASWTDASGNLWLYGGYGYDSAGSVNTLEDLWKLDPTTGEWTWITGSNVGSDQLAASYGTKGQASASNEPGSRVLFSHCADTSGNLWLFGGFGNVSGKAGGEGELNDLWKFDTSVQQWTWEAGGQVADVNGTTGSYGTEGQASASNVPPAREDSVCWFDKTGNFWLYGGGGEQTNTGRNDLWFYQVVN